MNPIKHLPTIFKTLNSPFELSNPAKPAINGCFSMFRSLHFYALSPFSINTRSAFLHRAISESGKQQTRGIRVQVRNGNLEQALVVYQRKMQSSGMERLIRRTTTHHLKNSEKRILAKKNLERRIRSEDFARKLRSILIKKVRYWIKYICKFF